MKIGIFGAQGHFGGSLYSRLQEIKPEHVELIPTVDKDHNKEIAELCDVVILVVQPYKMEALIQEIAPVLQPHCRVLSFAAKFPYSKISAEIKNPVARGMADPWWNISAFFLDENFAPGGLDFIFNALTKESPLLVKKDEEIDAFAIFISYLFVTLLLQKLGRLSNPLAHLEFLSDYIHLPMGKLQTLMPEGDPEHLLVLMATKGGITEKILQTLEVQPEIEPAKLFTQILEFVMS